jgi:hypothetical protein
MYAAKKKLGYRDVPHRTFQVCPVDLFYPVGPAARRLQYALGYMLSAWRRRSVAPPPLRISAITGFDHEFDRLAEASIAGDILTHWKPADYLQWRYCCTPGRSYRILQAAGPEGLRGAVVLRGPEGPERSAWIVDLIAVPTDLPAIDALIHAARNDLKARGTTAIWTLASSSLARQRLSRAGFLDTSRTQQFTYLVAGELPFDPAALDWNFFAGDGDSELYRPPEGM